MSQNYPYRFQNTSATFAQGPTYYQPPQLRQQQPLPHQHPQMNQLHHQLPQRPPAQAPGFNQYVPSVPQTSSRYPSYSQPAMSPASIASPTTYGPGMPMTAGSSQPTPPGPSMRSPSVSLGQPPMPGHVPQTQPTLPDMQATSQIQASQSQAQPESQTQNQPQSRPAPDKTVIRSGGGHQWTDPTLLEWDPSHFRLFVGNLAGEVTDDALFKAFSRYSSAAKARVIREKRTQKSKGYGFVSFADGDDYFRAAREMQGKYIGSHPVLLKKAVTEIKPISANAAKNNKKQKKNETSSGAGIGNATAANTTNTSGISSSTNVSGPSGKGKRAKTDGISKKQKTKGGLKLLG